MTKKFIVIAVVGVLVFLSHASEQNVNNLITKDDIESVLDQSQTVIQSMSGGSTELYDKIFKPSAEAMNQAWYGMIMVSRDIESSKFTTEVLQTNAILSLNITATVLEKIRNEFQNELSETSLNQCSSLIEKIEMMTQNKSVSPIVPQQDFSTNLDNYKLDDFICPDTFPVFCRYGKEYGCFANIAGGNAFMKEGCKCERMKYTMDIELFYLLYGLNDLIKEEKINHYQGEYLKVVTRYKNESPLKYYFKVPKLDFKVSELLKKDGISNMKNKQVTKHLQIVSIELKEAKKSDPSWIQKHCKICTVFLFFAIIFCRHYVYEKIKRKWFHNGDGKDDDESNDSTDDDEEKNADGNFDVGKTEVVASEI